MTATQKTALLPALGALVVIALALFPRWGSDYHLSFLINTLSYMTLATAWNLFSGSTRYISLASVAFFGAGTYLFAVMAESANPYTIFALAILLGLVISLFVGLATLRLSGIYFVIFTFGFAEFVAQITRWSEINIAGSLGRYVFADFSQLDIYYHLLGLVVIVFVVSWLVHRSRLGFALRVIGEDETVARHVGINTTLVKVSVFAISATFMTLTGAIMASRWTYIDPSIAFDPVVSFQVLIMALLGGVSRLWGPALGVLPLVFLFEILSASFPHYYSVVLGACFLVIVYFLPRGLVGLIEDMTGRLRRGGGTPGMIAETRT